MSLIQQILVPFDLSDRARAGVREAAGVAKKLSAQLLLLHVEDDSDVDYEGAESPGEQEAYEVDELAHLAHSAAPDAPIELLRRQGEAAAVILDLCRERDIDLIVMPRRDPASHQPFPRDSTAGQVLRAALCPVLTGRRLERRSGSGDYKRIACLTELKGDCEPLLRFAGDFARSYDAELTAIHLAPAFSLDPTAGAEFLSSVEASARLRLERLLAEAGATARVAVGSGDLEAWLPAEVVSRRTDLLILRRNPDAAPDGPPGLSAQACAAIRAAPCPVLSL